MIVRAITVYVKEGMEEVFKTATINNRKGSIAEPGILRFDILQNSEKPSEFFLYEVYASEEATLAHKETDHYKTWKETVEPMMAAKRIGQAFSVVEPSREQEW